MTFIETFLIAVGLAMDCFAVSLGIGTSPLEVTRRHVFRVAFHFGLFQGGMTLLGWLAGSTVAGFIAAFDHWIAMLLLSWVGVRMIHSGFKKDGDEECGASSPKDPTRGGTLVALSIATSIDASAVGLSLAMLNVNIAAAALTIGLTSLGLSIIGLRLGCRLGCAFGKRMELVGGIILVGIGLRIVLSHMLGIG